MIQTKEHLCKYVLHITDDQLSEVLRDINSFYYEKREPKLKNGVRRVNKDGSFRDRVLNPSTGLLKVLQRRLKTYISETLSLPDYAYGGVKGRDNILNAAQHKGKKYCFQTDLQDCFPFITCKDVCETLHKAGFSLTVARIITRLTTYQGHLPQGAPTSSIIQNLVFDYKVGRDIAKLAKEQGLTFTSFVDDITLSAPWNFQHLGNNIINAILSANLKISYRKTSFKSAQAIITGVKRGNNYLTIPDSQRSKFQDAALSADQKKGLEAYKKRIEKISPK